MTSRSWTFGRVVAAGVVALAAWLAQIATAGAQMRCWSSERLSARPGEEAIRIIGAAARIPRPTEVRTTLPPRAVGAIRRVRLPPGQKLVALTFDLCEQPNEIAGYQGSIVDHLRATGTRATFFAGGQWMASHGERAAQLAADPLFEIGGHGWGHRNLRLAVGQDLEDEVRGPQSSYAAALANPAARQCVASKPGAMRLFRFPYGACDARSLATVAAAGMLAIQWDVSSGDPAIGLDPARMAQSVIARVKPGSIVLFHANGRGRPTPEALPAIIATLARQGYRFVTVSELLAAGTPEITATCFDSRPGDTDRYDALARKVEARFGRQ